MSMICDMVSFFILRIYMLQVLDIESANVKALYRRAQAYMQTGDLFSAEQDVKKALEVDAQNREMKSLQKTLKQLKAESNKRDAKLYSNMFSHVTDTSVVTKKSKVEKADNEKRDDEVLSMDMENMGDSSAPPNSKVVLDPC
uniref:Uncharacterized protein n=1 Tax=Rhizophora mucronata TaxID=61149 RepID=A0A2P2NID5_RHIMU